MPTYTEMELSALPGTRDGERLLIVLVQTLGSGSQLEMRQQTFSESVGWFTQSTVNLEPQQVAGLKSVLGAKALSSVARESRPVLQFRQNGTPSWQPRLVQADSA